MRLLIENSVLGLFCISTSMGRVHFLYKLLTFFCNIVHQARVESSISSVYLQKNVCFPLDTPLLINIHVFVPLFPLNNNYL